MPNYTPNLGLIKPLVTEQYDIAKVTNENADILDSEIKSVKDDILDKQETLVSGTNIKTINSTSLLGSGDLEFLPKNNPISTGLFDLQGGQIKFPATQVPSADPNTLDDYEEGTFTPVLVGNTTAGIGTYTKQSGRYTKIGNLVKVDIELNWTAHTGTGNMRINGLPFVSKTDAMQSWGTVFSDMLTFTGYVICGIGQTSQQVILYRVLSNAGVDGVVMDTSAWVMLSIVYVAS